MSTIISTSISGTPPVQKKNCLEKITLVTFKRTGGVPSLEVDEIGPFW